jgi:SWI/SNF-related matrix-associated actin-dependent regulator of chromatin subfamily A3
VFSENVSNFFTLMLFTMMLTFTRDIKVCGRNDSLSQLESSFPGTALPWAIPGQYGFRKHATESCTQTSNVVVIPFSSQSATGSDHSQHETLQSSSQPRGGARLTPAQIVAQKNAQEDKDKQRASALKQTSDSLEKAGRRWHSLLNQLHTHNVLDLFEHLNPPGIESGELKVNLLKHQVCNATVEFSFALNDIISVKPLHGVLRVKIQFCLSQRPISRFSFGN